VNGEKEAGRDLDAYPVTIRDEDVGRQLKGSADARNGRF
jgi:hypothetical protein